MSEHELFQKQLSDREATALEALAQLGVLHITVPFEIVHSKLIMAQANPVDGESMSIEALYHDCLKDLYSIKADGYSSGIYAFYRSSEEPCPGEPYGQYLTRQISSLQASIQTSPYLIIKEIAAYCDDWLSRSLRKHLSLLNSMRSFSLLHGDLHSGNILNYRGSYKLIDFEFMRFGPIQLEIAFLLFWDYISGEMPFPQVFDLRRSAEQTGLLCGLAPAEAKQMVDIFLPVFLLCAASGLTEGYYSDPVSIQKGLKSFYCRNILSRGTNDSLC